MHAQPDPTKVRHLIRRFLIESHGSLPSDFWPWMERQPHATIREMFHDVAGMAELPCPLHHGDYDDGMWARWNEALLALVTEEYAALHPETP